MAASLICATLGLAGRLVRGFTRGSCVTTVSRFKLQLETGVVSRLKLAVPGTKAPIFRRAVVDYNLASVDTH